MKFKLTQALTLLLFCLAFADPANAIPKVMSPEIPPLPDVEEAAMAELASSPVTKLAAQTIGHPRITGEYLPEVILKDATGGSHPLPSITREQFTVLVFSKPENIHAEVASGYFRKVAPYLRTLGYQVILVTTENNDLIRKISERFRQTSDGSGHKSGIYLDEDRSAIIKMGLTNDAHKGAPMINAIYLVSPDDQIIFHYASISDKIPFSGEVLVLAARVYKDAFMKAEK